MTNIPLWHRVYAPHHGADLFKSLQEEPISPLDRLFQNQPGASPSRPLTVKEFLTFIHAKLDSNREASESVQVCRINTPLEHLFRLQHLHHLGIESSDCIAYMRLILADDLIERGMHSLALSFLQSEALHSEK